MFSPSRIALLSAFVVATSVTAISVATLTRTPKSTAAPMKMRVLRGKDKKHVKPTAQEVALHLAQGQEERKVEQKIPNYVPIKIRLRPDKEKKFKSLDNPEWYRAFELEVTNTSDKPIYFLELWLVYPEVISENDRRVGVALRYGRMDFVDFNARPLPTDVPILPGATITLKIPEQDQKGWVAHKIREKRSDPKTVEISFTQLSFGDGTGFNGSDARPYPFKQEQAGRANCNEPDTSEEVNKLLTRFPLQKHAMQKPADFLPVNFFRGNSFMSEPPAQSGLCCPGTDCSWKKNNTYSCSCRMALQRIVRIRKGGVQ